MAIGLIPTTPVQHFPGTCLYQMFLIVMGLQNSYLENMEKPIKEKMKLTLGPLLWSLPLILRGLSLLSIIIKVNHIKKNFNVASFMALVVIHHTQSVSTPLLSFMHKKLGLCMGDLTSLILIGS